MRLYHLFESKGRPENVDDLFMFLSVYDDPWDPNENPGGLGHKDPCPICRSPVENKRRGVGAPKFLGCRNFHAFVIDTPALKDVAPELQDELDEAHSCRFPPRDFNDTSQMRKNAKTGCKACTAMYDASLDVSFDVASLGYTPPSEEEPEEELSTDDKMQRILDLIKFDPRQEHSPGQFGTGHVAPIRKGDSPMVAGIKGYRDRDVPKDEITGKGKRARLKSRCGFNHTCSGHPTNPAWNYPLPDPAATAATGAYRYNNMFYYDPNSTREWPVSGMMGYEPKQEFEQYVNSKHSCKICTGEEEGCGNPVSHEYGVPKPFCQEHVTQSPYPKELLKTQRSEAIGGPATPREEDLEQFWAQLSVADRDKYLAMGPEKRHQEVRMAFLRGVAKRDDISHGTFVRKGDKVKARRGGMKKMGSGHVVEIDGDMTPNTHKVEWEDSHGRTAPAAVVDKESWRPSSWLAPNNLELLDY